MKAGEKASRTFFASPDGEEGRRDEVALLAHQCAAHRVSGDPDDVSLWVRLLALDPVHAVRVRRILDDVDGILRRLATEGERIRTPDVIMVLGYRLSSTGVPRPVLRERLRVAGRLARRFPSSVVLLSGGAVGATMRSEAAAMAEGLVAHGIGSDRLLREPYSRDTVENVQFARQFLLDLHAETVAVVSTEPHATRAMVLLELSRVAQDVWRCQATRTAKWNGECSALYRDALRLHGYPVVDIAPPPQSLAKVNKSVALSRANAASGLSGRHPASTLTMSDG